MKQPPFLRGYQQLKIPIIDEIGTPAWPELFPISEIEKIRDTVGPRHFSAQMMLEYISTEKLRLDPGALRFYTGNIDFRTAKLTTNSNDQITGMGCYWDPSTGQRNNDASVCVLILRDDKLRRAFIHDIRYLSVIESDIHPLSTQCSAALDFLANYGIKHLAIEVNGLGNALPEILRDVAIKRGQPLIVQKIVNRENKEKRILDAIEPLLTTGRLFAHERLQDTPLISEMQDWNPIGTNRDDGLDAIAGALRLSPIPLHPNGIAPRPISANINFKI